MFRKTDFNSFYTKWVSCNLTSYFFSQKKDIICIKSCIGVHVVKFQNNYKTNGPAHSLILWIICQRIKRDRKQEKINSV